MNKASSIKNWPSTFKFTDWPKGTLFYMSESVIHSVFKLRNKSLIPMWPSSIFDAHVRHTGNSRHSTKNKTRLSDATDMHVGTVENMIRVMAVAESLPCIGGIGIYFDTNTPMIHIDNRQDRLVWIRTSNGKYIYRENDYVKFYSVLAEEIAKA